MISSEFSIGSQKIRICEAHLLDRTVGEVLTNVDQVKDLLLRILSDSMDQQDFGRFGFN